MNNTINNSFYDFRKNDIINHQIDQLNHLLNINIHRKRQIQKLKKI